MTAKEELSAGSGNELQSDRQLFLQLYEADRNRLYSYIYAFMGNSVAADDVFQETSMVLWKEFAKFTPGTSFSKWANGIAFNRVRVYRRRHKKYSIGLSEEMIDFLADEVEKDDHAEERWRILQECRKRLREADKILYDDFYVNNHKAQTIADENNRSIFAVRKSIHKLRKKLFDCVDRKKNEELG